MADEGITQKERKPGEKVLIHWIWFAQLESLSQRQRALLLRRGFDPEDLFYAGKKELEGRQDLDAETIQALINKDLTQSQQIADQCKKKQIGVLTYRDAVYPSRLRNIEDPPAVLYYRGILPDFESQPVIAVVGTRKCTPYGVRTARSMGAQIAACGGLVISGAAAGIDTAAMEGALTTDTPVVGVLGCGVDVVYPRFNRKLYENVAAHGCLLSEYPPESKPDYWHFPQRNRIISGISNGILVVEAPDRSGALITVRCGLEQGKDVYAVPGNIDAPTCAGSNALLQDGAKPVMSGWDVVSEYEARYPNVVAKREVSLVKETVNASVQEPVQTPLAPTADKKDIDNPKALSYSGMKEKISQLSEEEKLVLSCLTPDPRLMDEIIARTALPAAKVLSIMTVLSLKGLVTHHPGRRVSANNQ